MNLNLLYLPNESAVKLLKDLKIEWDDTTCRDINIEDQKHLLMEIKDKHSPYLRTINTLKAIKNCMNDEAVSSILSANRITYGNNSEETLIRSYEVLIFDIKIISIRVKYTAKGKEQSRYIKESENAKVAELAKRVVHLLGLDMAMVKISLSAKRRWKVMNVDPSPVMRDQDCESAVNKIKSLYLIDEYLKNTEIKLGADPEFMMFNIKTGKMISASDYFPREGLVGCDNIRVPNRMQRPVAEIRPRPETCPLKLAENIKQALNTASRMAPYYNVRWAAGSQPVGGYSIGGHIHFSNIKLNAWILTALDNYLGIPVFLIEEPLNAIKRRKKYGFLGDYRLKDHGGFEYRTPASWLVSKETTTAVLCLAKIIASNFISLNQNHLNNAEAQKAFYSGDQEYFRPIFTMLWKDIEASEMFNEYAEHLNVFPRMIDEGIHWNERTDLRKAWKVTIPSRKSDLKMKNRSRDLAPVSPSILGTNAPGTSTAGRNNRSGGGIINSSVNIVTSRAAGNNRNQTNRRSDNPRSGRIVAPHQIRRSHVVR
ncbi:MAG: hypothetical protein ABFD08_19310 [Syntrophomonas sp.]